jgi:hypothetical protein
MVKVSVEADVHICDEGVRRVVGTT